MIKASDLARGTVVAINKVPHIVEDLTVQSPSARGAASLYKFRFRNLKTYQKVDQSLKGDDPLQDVDLERRKVQVAYMEQDACTFMDAEDFSQFTLRFDAIPEQRPYLTEDLEGILALFSDGQLITIELPPSVDLPITECSPSMRGASVTARTKAATLSTGLIVQVPEYLDQGTLIRVDTRTGKFVCRA